MNTYSRTLKAAGMHFILNFDEMNNELELKIIYSKNEEIKSLIFNEQDKNPYRMLPVLFQLDMDDDEFIKKFLFILPNKYQVLKEELSKALSQIQEKKSMQKQKTMFWDNTTITSKSKLKGPTYQIILDIATNPKISYDLYRFGIDLYKQNIDCVAEWERREQGSLKAILQGWVLVIELLQNEINPFEANIDNLKKLHSTVTANVGFDRKIRSGEFKTENIIYQGDVKERSIYNTPKCNLSKQGILELIAKSNYFNNYPEIDSPLKNCLHIDPQPKNLDDFNRLLDEDKLHLEFGLCMTDQQSPVNLQEQLHKKTEAILDQYKHNIQHAKSTDDKLSTIVDCIRSLEVLHPFADANCRTICVLFLNTLLMSEGFLPAIVLNPNKFDGYAIHELVEMVKVGIKNTENLSKGIPLIVGKTLQFQPGSYSENDKEILDDIMPGIIQELNLLKEITIEQNKMN
ncbi:MAG: hypothetical protein HYX60_04300 [Legionella longbeachae]|nr:hypothetical protein [Legionella longbeachae]